MVKLQVRWEEKRKRRRINLDFPVKVGICRKRWHLLSFLIPCCSGTLVDASTEGLQVCIDAEVEAGAHLKFWIDAWRREGRRRVVVCGTVMWVRAADDGQHWMAGIQLSKWPRRGMRIWWDIVTEHLGLRGGVGATR